MQAPALDTRPRGAEDWFADRLLGEVKEVFDYLAGSVDAHLLILLDAAKPLKESKDSKVSYLLQGSSSYVQATIIDENKLLQGTR